MPIQQPDLQQVKLGGYESISEKSVKATYALYPGDDSGNPLTGWEKFTYGTAFSVSEDGLFLTASHVLKDIRDVANGRDYNLCLVRGSSLYESSQVRIVDLTVEKEYPAQIQDIALLSVDTEESLPYLKVRTQGPVENMGSPVATYGFPINRITDLDDAPKDQLWDVIIRTFHGVVTQFISQIGLHPYYEVDTLFNQGLSGGPLISLEEGDVVGVISSFIWDIDTVEYNRKEILAPYPAHISQAKVLTEQDDNDIDTWVGKELEDRGVEPSST